MKKDFDKLMNEIKEGLNNFIKPEMEKEEIDKIASLNTLLDNINTEYETVGNEYNELKNDYIKIVKNTSFKSDHDPREDDIGRAPSIEDLTNEIFG